MSTLLISKGHLPSTVSVPTSKSYANRALILAALKSKPFTLKNMPEASDVTFLIEALVRAGVRISKNGNDLVVHNSFPECESTGAFIDAGEGGTTARFLAALLLLGKRNYTLKLGKRLKERPWAEFISMVKLFGATAALNDNELTLQGPISAPPELEVDCARTTQFATGFDLVLRNTKVIPTNLKTSMSYWNMNLPMKEHFEKDDTYLVPVDWSSASYPMTFAALNHSIDFPGLHHDPFQADAKLFAILQNLGAVTVTPEGMRVNRVCMESQIKLVMSDCLDLFPAMSYLVAHLEGEHELSGIGNLVHKESDRLNEVCKLLSAFGRDYEITGDVLKIQGSHKMCGERHLTLPDDHRIVMTGALFLRHHQGGTLTNAESVNKSYPGFFDLLK